MNWALEQIQMGWDPAEGAGMQEGERKRERSEKKEEKGRGKRSRESCAGPGDLKGEASHSWAAAAAEAQGSRAMIRGGGSLCFP